MPSLRISAEYCSDRPQLVFRKAVPCAVLRVVPLGNHVPRSAPTVSLRVRPGELHRTPRRAKSDPVSVTDAATCASTLGAPLDANAAIGRCFFVHHPEQLKEFFLPGGTGAGGRRPSEREWRRR